MAFPLQDKKIVLGITGGIAAYKVADWLRQLRREGAEVTVVMTEAACRFVTPLTFAALSGNPVHSDTFAESDAQRIPHIALAREADLVVLAPATANTIAKLAHGLADTLLTTILLATKAPVVVCPAMNSNMYQHPATTGNLMRLRQYGHRVVEPETGSMACGDEGPGRLPEWPTVRQQLVAAVSPQDLKDLTVLVTAGPTREPLDPVRFISNRSTGRMGYELAATANQRGARVILVSGPSSLPSPAGVETIRVTTASEMHQAIMDHCRKVDVVVKAAAVSDYRPRETSPRKIKKGSDKLSMELEKCSDILKELGELKKSTSPFPLLVGFAAESHDHLEEGMRKLKEKNLDGIVVNDILGTSTGFAAETNRVVICDRDQNVTELPLLSKEETAHQIWDNVLRLLKDRYA